MVLSQGGAIVSLHCTSLISLILEPPFPIREPHWLAGTTSLRVTGGLLVAGLLLMELMMSWKNKWRQRLRSKLTIKTEKVLRKGKEKGDGVGGRFRVGVGVGLVVRVGLL